MSEDNQGNITNDANIGTQGGTTESQTPNNPLLSGINADNAQNGDSKVNGWLISQDIPGTGEKPDWFNSEQFKTIFDQAKSQADIRKMLGSRTGAPEEYNYDLSQLGDQYKELELDKNDPLLLEFSKFAKNEKLSQQGFNEVLKMFVDYSQMQNSKETDELVKFQKQELDALGGPKEAQRQIGEMTDWFKQNFPDFDPQDFQDLMYFAGGVKILKAMREKMRYSPVPSATGAGDGKDYIDPHDLRKMINDPKYQSDPTYQKKVDALYERKYG